MCVTQRQSSAVPTRMTPHMSAYAIIMPGTHRHRGARPSSSWAPASTTRPPTAATASRQRGIAAFGFRALDDAERATTKTYTRAAPHSARAVNRRGMSGRDSNTSVDPAREARQSRHERLFTRPGNAQVVSARHQALLVGDAAHVGEIDEVAGVRPEKVVPGELFLHGL